MGKAQHLREVQLAITGRVTVGERALRRLTILHWVARGQADAAEVVKAQADRSAQQFAEALQSVAEAMGIDPSTNFKFNLDEGWLAPAEEVPAEDTAPLMEPL